MKQFFQKVGAFLRSARDRWNRESPAFWKWMNRTGVGITTLCSSLLVPDIPGELGGVFEYHLVPWIHTAVTYALTFGFTMTFISRFAAINAPQADKTLEK